MRRNTQTSKRRPLPLDNGDVTKKILSPGHKGIRHSPSSRHSPSPVKPGAYDTCNDEQTETSVLRKVILICLAAAALLLCSSSILAFYGKQIRSRGKRVSPDLSVSQHDGRLLVQDGQMNVKIHSGSGIVDGSSNDDGIELQAKSSLIADNEKAYVIENGDGEEVSAPTEIPHNLVFVTDRLPGDPKLDPRTLEIANIWQDLYKGKTKYKIHFFPSSHSIEKFIETNAPEYIVPFRECVTKEEMFDLARLVILYVLGGISADISVARPLERLDLLLRDLNPNKDRRQFIVSVDYDFETLHDSKLWAYPRQKGIALHCFAVSPRHPVLKTILNQVSYNLMHRNQVDAAILKHGYPLSLLQDQRKSTLIRRAWTTGSGPFSDVIFNAIEEQRKKAMIEWLAATREKSLPSPEVISLPLKTFMSAHPGGMRFHNLQRSQESDNTFYLGIFFDKKNSENIRRKNYLVYDESHLPLETYHSVAAYTYLIGAVRDASQIEETSFKYLVELSCKHGVNVHIVVGGGIEQCRKRFNAAVTDMYSPTQQSRCGRLELLEEPVDLHSLENRVDRIAYLRDFQREHLRVVLENGQEDDIIIVADLDLFALPPVKKLMHEVNRMRQLHEYDVLCSNGLMHRPNGYYDLYATVLLPDTFVYPVRHRLLGKSWEGEDMNIVRSNDEFGEVTSWDVLDWIESEGKRRKNEAVTEKANKQNNVLWEKVGENQKIKNISNEFKQRNDHITELYGGGGDPLNTVDYGEYDDYEFENSSAVPVRSCFGGLTIYFATALLEPGCRYHAPTVGERANRLLKYANYDDKRPCEHVVFHDCLVRHQEKNGIGYRIAIQPDMRTMWNDIPSPTNRLISDSNQDALITFFNQRDRGDKLISHNGQHTLRINEDGILVIESCDTDNSNCSEPTVRLVSHPSNRSNSVNVAASSNGVAQVTLQRPNWTHMFLIIEGSGNLILLKQVPKKRLQDGGKKCGNPDGESCQLEVWSANLPQKLGKSDVTNTCPQYDDGKSFERYELTLEDDGFIEVREWHEKGEKRAKILWRNNGVAS